MLLAVAKLAARFALRFAARAHAIAMSLLHRLLQRRWAQEAIPDTPAEPASAPAALPSIDDAAALERLSSRHIAPIHERLYNNTYQADANALLEQLETTAPAALQPFTSSPTQPPPQLAADPSSLSESKSPPTRATASVRSVRSHNAT